MAERQEEVRNMSAQASVCATSVLNDVIARATSDDYMRSEDVGGATVFPSSVSAGGKKA